MLKTIDFPVVLGGLDSKNGEITASFPDVPGAQSKGQDEDHVIDQAVAELERIVGEGDSIPTASDLSYISRENPGKVIRLITIDVAEINNKHKLVTNF